MISASARENFAAHFPFGVDHRSEPLIGQIDFFTYNFRFLPIHSRQANLPSSHATFGLKAFILASAADLVRIKESNGNKRDK